MANSYSRPGTVGQQSKFIASPPILLGKRDCCIPVAIRPRDLAAAIKDLNERAAPVVRKASELPLSIFGALGKEDTLR
jgi:hypothetical protein